MKTAAIVIAAGASRRFGSPKQLAELGGQKLLDRAVSTCFQAALEPVVVVLGANAEAIKATCDLSATRVVLNDEWQEGLAASLRAGIASLRDEDVDAAVIVACDMPFVDAAHLRALAAKVAETDETTASFYEGRRGVPVCFLRGAFDALLMLSGDSGAKDLLVDARYIVLSGNSDVDTPEQLEDAKRQVAG